MECVKEQLSDAYDTGYAYGCNDAGISDPDNRYINQPGKGPSLHTISFMNGYNDGFYLCMVIWNLEYLMETMRMEYGFYEETALKDITDKMI